MPPAAPTDKGGDTEMAITTAKDAGSQLTAKEIRIFGQLVAGDRPAAKLAHVGSHTVIAP